MHCDPGDTLGFSSWSRLGIGINLCTWGVPFWGLSHVAGIVRLPGESRLVICESTTTCAEPCLLCGQRHDGVQFHYIPQRIREYRGLVWRYPLKRRMTLHESRRVGAWCMAQHGKGYDYLGAFGARETLAACLLRKPEDLQSLFCSELWAAALREIGRLDTDNASAWSPNLLCRRLRRRGVVKKPQKIKGKPCPKH